MIPSQIKKTIEYLTKLPSLGPRQAIRMAFYLAHWTKDELTGFSTALLSLSTIKTCPECNFIHENEQELCSICSDPNRLKHTIAVVEKPTDVLTLEQTKKFQGVYFVFGNFQKEKNGLQSLKNKIETQLGGKAEEIILAINHTTHGDINAQLITQELQAHAKKISRLGRGIPTGGEIEFADEDTLGSAFDNRG